MLSSNAVEPESLSGDGAGEDAMSRVVPLPIRGRRSPSRGVRREASAEILFFTGVRYERQTSAEETGALRPRPARRRRPGLPLHRQGVLLWSLHCVWSVFCSVYGCVVGVGYKLCVGFVL